VADDRLAEQTKELLTQRICILLGRWEARVQNAVGTTVKSDVYFCSKSLYIFFPVHFSIRNTFNKKENYKTTAPSGEMKNAHKVFFLNFKGENLVGKL
jgi:hypothetical protein